MTRVGLLCSEPVRPTMGGIGVRYLELARTLRRAGFEVVLVSPAPVAESAACGIPAEIVRSCATEPAADLLRDRDVVVAQGQLANDLVAAAMAIPLVIDLYDPWLIENLHYSGPLGLDPYRNDHASWLVQMGAGDFFLCSSTEQRLFYLGFLTALGRVHPRRIESDPTLDGLLAAVPFGSDPALTGGPPLLAERRPGERRILFGGVYDWYDVDTFVNALERLENPDWTALVVRHPRPESTPQEAFRRLESEVAARPGWTDRVRFIDWIPALRRHDLLAEVDVLAAPHRASVEADLAFRTRFLDALAVGCPVVASSGGTVARRLAEQDAGWVVPIGEAAALAGAIDEAVAGGEAVAARVERGRGLAAEYGWDRVVAPLVEFLRRPQVDVSKSEFGHRLETRAPRDRLGFRLRRKLISLARR